MRVNKYLDISKNSLQPLEMCHISNPYSNVKTRKKLYPAIIASHLIHYGKSNRYTWFLQKLIFYDRPEQSSLREHPKWLITRLDDGGTEIHKLHE